MYEEPGITVEDGENFRVAGDLGIKQIVLDQYRRCCLEGSKEMLKGGEATKIIKGVPVPVLIENQREVFMNSILMLEITLIPDLIRKEPICEQMTVVDDKIKEIKKIHHDRFDKFKERVKKDKNLSWNDGVSMIQDDLELNLIEPFREKLTVLSILLKEINYFDEGVGYN